MMYSTYLNDINVGHNRVTFGELNLLAKNPQSDINAIVKINNIVREYINKDEMIGKTYETIESNVNTTYSLAYPNFNNNRNKKKTLERVKEIIEQFNHDIALENFIRTSIPTVYTEGNYLCYLKHDNGSYAVDYYPLGVAIISDYTVNNEPYLLIDINELKSRLQKIYPKTRKNQALFFSKMEEEVKESYPTEIYEAFKNKENYAKLDIAYSGTIRTGNMNRKYGLTPIFRALKSALMLEEFDYSDMMTARTKSKKIIHQIMRKEIMGTEYNKKALSDMAYAHSELLDAFRQPTVIITSPPTVEEIKYVEPTAESTNSDTIENYRNREMLALGIAFISPDKGQTVTTASITVAELAKTINKIAESVAEVINKWYRTVLKENGIDIAYAPTISINSSETLEYELRQKLASLLFTTMSASRKTTFDILGIDLDEEVQRRKDENEQQLDEIFKPRATANTTSGNANSDGDTGGRPADGDDETKQLEDKIRNKNKI